MQTKRSTVGERCACKLRSETLFVETVAAFVQGTEQPGWQEIFVDTCSQANISN